MNGYEFEKIRRKPKIWSDSKIKREIEKHRTLSRSRGRNFKMIEQNNHEVIEYGATPI